MTQLKKSHLETIVETDDRRVFRLLTWLSVMAFVFLIGIGGKSWYSGNEMHAKVLWLFAGATVVHLLGFWRRKSLAQQKVYTLLIVATLFCYLIASGGESNTGPLWFYALPPLVFYLTDLKIGFLILLCSFLFAVIVFQFPQLPFVTAEYHSDFKVRFFAALIFESIFCFILEASRLKARNDLITLASTHERAASTDELTGLANRRYMQYKLETEHSRFQRSGHHFSVILIDLDWFKNINDKFGHDAGDAALVQFSELMVTIARQTDTVSRWGGEEFLILLPDTSLLQALSLAERLRKQVVNAEFVFEDQKLPLSISAGVGSISQCHFIEQLLSEVDTHLYAAKNSGRNCIAPRVRTVSDAGASPVAT